MFVCDPKKGQPPHRGKGRKGSSVTCSQTVYLVNSGSEANELALLLARLHTGHQDVISIQNGYHGLTGNLLKLTAMSVVMCSNLCAGQSIHHAMCPDVFKGIWGGKMCRDSPVQTHRSCECDRRTCQAADKYYQQLEDMFAYSVPRGRVAGFFAESIQVGRLSWRTGRGPDVRAQTRARTRSHALCLVGGLLHTGE